MQNDTASIIFVKFYRSLEYQHFKWSYYENFRHFKKFLGFNE